MAHAEHPGPLKSAKWRISEDLPSTYKVRRLGDAGPSSKRFKVEHTNSSSYKKDWYSFCEEVRNAIGRLTGISATAAISNLGGGNAMSSSLHATGKMIKDVTTANGSGMRWYDSEVLLSPLLDGEQVICDCVCMDQPPIAKYDKLYVYSDSILIPQGEGTGKGTEWQYDQFSLDRKWKELVAEDGLALKYKDVCFRIMGGGGLPDITAALKIDITPESKSKDHFIVVHMYNDVMHKNAKKKSVVCQKPEHKAKVRQHMLEFIEVFEQLPYKAYLGPGSGELWNIERFDEECAPTVERIQKTRAVSLDCIKSFTTLPKADRMHFGIEAVSGLLQVLKDTAHILQFYNSFCSLPRNNVPGGRAESASTHLKEFSC